MNALLAVVMAMFLAIFGILGGLFQQALVF